MRDLELNYAEASAPLQRRLAELESLTKERTSELVQKIEELNTDLFLEQKKNSELESSLGRLKEQVQAAEKHVVSKDDEVAAMKREERLEMETLRLALEQTQVHLEGVKAENQRLVLLQKANPSLVTLGVAGKPIIEEEDEDGEKSPQAGIK